MVCRVHIILKTTWIDIPSDMSLYHSTNEDGFQGMIAVYVDDSLAAGNQNFMNLTNKIPEDFDSKPKAFPPFLFAGVMINTDQSGYFLVQKNYSDKIEKLQSNCDFELFSTLSPSYSMAN